MASAPGDFIETIAAGMPFFDKAEVAAASQAVIDAQAAVEYAAESLPNLTPTERLLRAHAAITAENRLALMLLHNRLLMKEV